MKMTLPIWGKETSLSLPWISARTIRWLLAFFIFSTSGAAAIAQNNGAMACNDLVQVSLDSDCEAEIFPDMVLEGTYPDLSIFSVRISGHSTALVSTPGVYSVTVTNNVTGNRCWGDIRVEDKLPPQITDCLCPPGNTDTLCAFLCTDLAGIEAGTFTLPQPEIYEACSDVDTTTSDVVTEIGCGRQLLTRTLLFTDASGNTSTCTQEFRLNPVDLSAVVRPVSPISLPCGSDDDPASILAYYTPLVGLADARTYAYPTVNGMEITAQTCNIMSTFTDTKAPACKPECSNSFKLIRRYLIIDWCNGDMDEFTQIIEAKDDTDPIIEASDVVQSVDPWGCMGTVVFDPPTTLTDACTDYVIYRVEGPLGVTVNYNVALDRWMATGLPLGDHVFRYIAEDCCGNEAVDNVNVKIQDNSSPIAVAKQNIVVSLTSAGGDGQAKIFAASVDNGSYDGCTNVYLELRRDSDNCDIVGNTTYNNDGHIDDSILDVDNGQYVKFCCEDLDQVSPAGVRFGDIKVWMRVWDDGDQDGVYGSAGDNYNETWTMVRLEDKLTPLIACPVDVTIQCYDSVDDLSIVGAAAGTHTCGPADVDYVDLSDMRDDCGYGSLVRRWFIVGTPQVRCEQIITVEEHDLFEGDIIWPADETTDCLNLRPADEPTWSGSACSSVGYSLQSDTFQFVDDVCFKILNHYTVIDWCQFDPNYPSQGRWEYTQVVKVIDEVAPVFDMCRDTIIALNDHSDVDNDGDRCEAVGIQVTNSATDAGDCASDWLRWDIRIDLDGVTGADYEYSSYVSRLDNTFDDDNGNGIPDRYIGPTMSGELVTVTIPEDLAGPMSNATIHWTVTDGCGNRRSCTTALMVVDAKPPTPYCVSISTALMETTGRVELWAADFDLGSFDNCTDAADLLFTFDNAVPITALLDVEHFFKGNGQSATIGEYNLGTAQRWIPATNTSGMIFTCDDLPITDVIMTVHDSKGNSDFCEVRLTINDNFGACSGIGGRAVVSGSVITDQGMAIGGAKVTLDPGSIDLEIVTETDNNGNYAFPSVTAGQDYTLSADFDGRYDDGISTLDLVLMQRHILGLSPLNNPYRAIAADVNGSESITGADVVVLRKLILGVTVDMAGNDSWLFVDADKSYGDNNNPWPVSYLAAMLDLTGNAVKDLVAIKVGDLNGSAVANMTGQDIADTRSQPVTLFLQQGAQSIGDVQTIDIRASDMMTVHGLQMSLDLDDLEYISVVPGALTLAPSDLAEADGLIKISHAARTPVSVEINDVLFSIEVRGEQSAPVSSIQMTEALQPEIYLGDDVQTHNIELAVLRGAAGSGFALYQNQPNPFKGETMIAFDLPEAGTAILSIYDINGRVLFNNTATYEAGKHTIMIDRSLINTSGVLYYRLESGDQVATKKMIQIQ